MPTRLFHDLLPDFSSKLVRWLARVTDAVAIQGLKGLSMRLIMLLAGALQANFINTSPDVFPLHVTIRADRDFIGSLWQTTHS